jgi:hypothetical protein
MKKIILSNDNLKNAISEDLITNSKVKTIIGRKNITEFYKDPKISGATELFLNIHGTPNKSDQNKLSLGLTHMGKYDNIGEKFTLSNKESIFSNFINKLFEKSTSPNIIHVNSCFGGLAQNEIKNLKGDYVVITYINSDRSNMKPIVAQNFQDIAKSQSFENFISTSFHHQCAVQSVISYKIGNKIYKFEFDIDQSSYDNKTSLSKSLKGQYFAFQKFYSEIKKAHFSTHPELFCGNLPESINITNEICNKTANSALLRTVAAKDVLKELNKNLLEYDNIDYVDIIHFALFNDNMTSDKKEILRLIFESEKSDFWQKTIIQDRVKYFIKSAYDIKVDILNFIIEKTNFSDFSEEDIIHLAQGVNKNNPPHWNQNAVNNIKSLIKKHDKSFTPKIFKMCEYNDNKELLSILKELVKQKAIDLSKGYSNQLNSIVWSKDIDLLEIFVAQEKCNISDDVIYNALFANSLEVIKCLTSQKDFQPSERVLDQVFSINNTDILEFFSKFNEFKFSNMHILTAQMNKYDKSLSWFIEHYTDELAKNGRSLNNNFLKSIKKHPEKSGYYIENSNKLNISSNNTLTLTTNESDYFNNDNQEGNINVVGENSE